MFHDDLGGRRFAGQARDIWYKALPPDQSNPGKLRLLANLVQSMVGKGKNKPKPLPNFVSMFPPENCDKLSLWMRDELCTFWQKLWERSPKLGAAAKGPVGFSTYQ